MQLYYNDNNDLIKTEVSLDFTTTHALHCFTNFCQYEEKCSLHCLLYFSNRTETVSRIISTFHTDILLCRNFTVVAHEYFIANKIKLFQTNLLALVKE